MRIRLHPHARARLIERGTNVPEVIETVQRGQSTPARLGRTRFRMSFGFNGEWRGRRYATKQLDVFAEPDNDWLIITVIVRYF